MMSTSYGAQFVKNTVKMLVKDPSCWHGYDSALRLFEHFRDRFSEEEYVAILSNENLFRGFRGRKVLSLAVIRMTQQPKISRELLAALTAVNDRLSSDSDEIIQTNALKGKILLMAR